MERRECPTCATKALIDYLYIHKCKDCGEYVCYNCGHWCDLDGEMLWLCTEHLAARVDYVKRGQNEVSIDSIR